MEDTPQPQGEFHHFQLVSADGEIPMSISVLVHYNQKAPKFDPMADPITAQEIVDFHDSLSQFDGDYTGAFNTR